MLYFPDGDFDDSPMQGSATTTECPYRGTATWWSLRFDSHSAQDAIWAYRDPKPGHEWLRGYRALRWDAVDAWFCEDERLFGHLKDPFHRVDVFEGSQQVTVRAGDLLIASSVRPKLLFETGLPARIYLPGADMLPGLLSPSQTRSICPYKGEASYWTLKAGAHTIEDAARSYETPLPEAFKVQGHLCFETGEMEVTLGEPEDRLRSEATP